MFEKFGGEVIDDIKEYEKLLKTKLPEDYRDFLINTNGGCFRGEIHTFWVEYLKEDFDMAVLCGFNQEVREFNLHNWHREFGYELLEDMAIIGYPDGGGLLLLIWQDDWQGVFFWDHCLDFEESTEEECLYKIADDFTSFFNSLQIRVTD